MVARERELDLLIRLWREVQEGQGRAVWVQGEAGIGKSPFARRAQGAVGRGVEMDAHSGPVAQSRHTVFGGGGMG